MLLNLKGMTGPLHRRIYYALKSAIVTGRFGPSARLPSSRMLAADLKVSRNTVVLAYEQLIAEGYVVGRHRSMMSVTSTVPARQTLRPIPPKSNSRPKLSGFGRRLATDKAAPPSSSYASRPGLRYDFRYGRPAVDDFPRQALRQLLSAPVRRSSPDSLNYGSPAGHGPLREALAGYLARARGLSCSPDQIVIVNGSQQAFDLIARVLLDPGDNVVIEEPHYHGSRISFRAAGARLIAVPVDGDGIDTSKLPPLNVRARLVCVTPCHQFPSGVVMPVGRRLALLNWASRMGAWVVEDDYISEFRYEGHPIEALRALDHEDRVIYIGTFSKVLFPALRIAYVVLPSALLRPFLAAKWITDRYTSTLGQEALTDFISSGQFERYLRRTCTRNAARRRTLIASLRQHLGDRIEIAGENAGVHLLVWLKDRAPQDVEVIIERAARVGVGLYPVTQYYLRPPRRAGLLFGYASLSEAEIRAGIRRLADIL
jgi:GntR family transcriptional regulator/MocR family aminotransferase